MKPPSVTAFAGFSGDQIAGFLFAGVVFTTIAGILLCEAFDSWLPWQLAGPVWLLIVYGVWLCRWTFAGRDDSTMFLRRRRHPLGRRTTVAIMPSSHNDERCTCIGCPSAYSSAYNSPSNSYYWAHSGKLLTRGQEQMLQVLRITLAKRASNERRIEAAVKHLALPEEN